MPPRRRKRRKSSGELPKLTFVESPRNIIHKLPSPVFSADHPMTADVIPFNEASVHWVSPQFHGVPQSERRTRKRHCSKQNLTTNTSRVTRARTRSGNIHAPIRNRDYVSLQFVEQPLLNIDQPPSPEQAVIIQTVDLLNQLDTSLPPTAHVVTPNVTPNVEVGLYNNTPKKDNPLDISDDLPNMGRRRKSTAAHKKKYICRENFNMNFDSPSCVDSPLFGNNHPLPANGRQGVKRQTRTIPGHTCSDTSYNGNADETKLRPKTAGKKPSSKRLFGKNNQDFADCDENANSLVNISASPKLTRTLQTKEHELLFSDLLHTPKQTYSTDNYNVLVYDTPEEDYGLPVRSRRRKNMQRRSYLL